MKKVFYSMIAILAINSCGLLQVTSKQTQDSENSQVSQTQTKVRTQTRTLREDDPCDILADEKPFAAVGIATSYDEQVARDESARNARYELGRMLEYAVSGIAQDYSRNAGKNGKRMTESLNEALNEGIFNQSLKNTRVIKRSVYDLEGGLIEVRSCVEMVKAEDELKKALEKVLPDNEVYGIELDRQAFIESVKDKMQEYKANSNEGK